VQKTLGTTTFAFDFWLDSSQRLRKMTFGFALHNAQPGPNSNGGEGSQKAPVAITQTLNVSNYGVPVDVTAPPPSEVTPEGTCSSNSSGVSCEQSGSSQAP